MDFGSARAWLKERLFGLWVGSHHELLSPNRIRKHSIEDQLSMLNVGIMAYL